MECVNRVDVRSITACPARREMQHSIILLPSPYGEGFGGEVLWNLANYSM